MLTDVDRAIAMESVLFRSLPRGEADAMLSVAKRKRIVGGETVFLQGDPADNFFIVLDGWLKLYRVDEHGHEAVVSVFSKSQSFGEAVALTSARYPVSAEAVTAAKLLAVPASHLISRIQKQPELALALVGSTFRHLHELVGQIEHLKARSGAQRVGEFLLELCAQTDGACEVHLPYDKVLIAGRLGMKPESLSRVFAKLRGHGVTIMRDRALIADIRKLRDFCAGDRSDPWQKAG